MEEQTRKQWNKEKRYLKKAAKELLVKRYHVARNVLVGYHAITKYVRQFRPDLKLDGYALLKEFVGAAPERPKKNFSAPKRNDGFYETREWREVRYKALQMYAGKCMCCGRGAGQGVMLHVDHIKPRSKFPELALSLENLQVLCEDCNLGKSNKDSTDWRWNVEIGEGNVIPIRA